MLALRPFVVILPFLAATVVSALQPGTVKSSRMIVRRSNGANSKIVGRGLPIPLPIPGLEGVSAIEDILSTLQGKTGGIAGDLGDLSALVPTGGLSDGDALAQFGETFSSLELALNVALAGVTKLVGQVKEDVNLLNLAATVSGIVFDLVPALDTVEKGLALNPALTPLITTLAALLNGPLLQLLTVVVGLTNGLLPVVQGLLFGLGLGPVLGNLQGTLFGLLSGLGL